MICRLFFYILTKYCSGVSQDLDFFFFFLFGVERKVPGLGLDRTYSTGILGQTVGVWWLPVERRRENPVTLTGRRPMLPFQLLFLYFTHSILLMHRLKDLKLPYSPRLALLSVTNWLEFWSVQTAGWGFGAFAGTSWATAARFAVTSGKLGLTGLSCLKAFAQFSRKHQTTVWHPG